VIYGYGEEKVGVAAGELAVRVVNHLVRAEEGFDFLAELEALIRLADGRRSGRRPRPSWTRRPAATSLHPAERAVAGAAGQGKYQQRIRATMTSKTAALAVDIAGDKKITTSLLAAAGLPVPAGRWSGPRTRR
jgi:cyanophycin synthetase